MDTVAVNRLLSELGEALASREGSMRLRTLRVIERVRGPLVTINGREVVSFCSNDYLGLSQDPRLIDAGTRAGAEYGWGAGSSRLLGGTSRWHVRLEEKFAAFKREEAALYFPSGYMANLGLITALADSETLIASDELNHASVIDACRLSRARVERYRHADPGDARRILERGAKRKLLVSDTVFSMDGDIAPLRDLLRVAEEQGAQFIVDDAHGTGVLGGEGRGALEHFGLEGRGILQSANLAKAAGSVGGFVVGPVVIRDWLVNASRPFIYTTAPPPAVAAIGCTAVELMADAHDARRCLRENVAYVATGFGMKSETPIFSFVLGTEERALKASVHLWERGLFVPAIRPPTVPDGTARLRISLSAHHDRAHLDALIEGVKSL